MIGSKQILLSFFIFSLHRFVNTSTKPESPEEIAVKTYLLFFLFIFLSDVLLILIKATIIRKNFKFKGKNQKISGKR